MDTNINFVFLRHGYGCHNALPSLYRNNVITKATYHNEASNSQNDDPELTPIGVQASLHNGCVISNVLKDLKYLTKNPLLDTSEMHVVGCSPLIRCMETAYFMTRNWKTPPQKIYVFPYLREINESSDDKYSKSSLKIMETTPAYAMKTILDQKMYLHQKGILD